MDLIRLHPFGVLTGNKGITPTKQNLVVINKDDTIVELYKQFQTSPTLSLDSVFLKKVITYVISKFDSDFEYWLRYQAKNSPFLTDTNYEFLVDTSRFIATGGRQVHIRGWEPLLSYHSDKATTDKILPVLERKSKPYQYIQDWLSRENGFYDMLTTLFLIYGKE